MCWKTTPVWQRHWELTGTVWWHPADHTPNVRLVTEEDAGKGVVRERDYTDVDGLITNVPDLTLATFMQTVCLCILWIRNIKPSAFPIPVGGAL